MPYREKCLSCVDKDIEVQKMSTALDTLKKSKAWYTVFWSWLTFNWSRPTRPTRPTRPARHWHERINGELKKFVEFNSVEYINIGSTYLPDWRFVETGERVNIWRFRRIQSWLDAAVRLESYETKKADLVRSIALSREQKS